MDDIVDAFNSDEAERRYLVSKPTSFLVLGKQGSGKSTLAKKFARAWKCILVSPADVVQEAIAKETDLGKQANSFLLCGAALPDALLLKLLSAKLNSQEVKHHGYILDGFPLLVADEKVMKMQLDFIRNLTLKPDYLINIKIADQDLFIRRIGFKVDPMTNKLYTKAFYDPEKVVKPQAKDALTEEEEEEEEEGTEEEEAVEEEEVEEDDIFDELNFDENPEEIINRLIVRNEESEENIQKKLKEYQDHILGKLEDFLSSHDQRKLIELDGNLSAKDLFNNLLSCLQPSLLSGTRLPLRLQGKEDQEEIGEDIDTEDMLRSLAASENISPGYRWRRSKWGRLCPVALSEGQNMMGNPLYAVSFLDKMYVMSTPEALELFMNNPRHYLLPPQPAPPCKVAVVGPPHSGRSTLAQRLAQRYAAKVINVDELMEPKLKEAKEALIAKNTQDLINNSIVAVKAEEEIKKRDLAAKQESEDEDEENLPQQDETPIDENHPAVKKLVETGMPDIEGAKPVTSPEVYVDCLERVMTEIYKGTDKGPSSGGWIIDGFPQTKDHFNSMVERGIVPDEFIILKDDSNENDVLVKRAENGDTSIVEDPAKIQAFKEKVTEVENQLTSLQTTLRNAHNIEPLAVPCEETEDDAYLMCTKNIEAQFQYYAMEYTGMDQDEEEEDANALVEDDMDEDEDEDPNDRKPFGETLRYCPVMLKEDDVLAPGSNEFAAKYRERVYFLTSQEHKERFMSNPEMYLPQNKPLNLPPVRLLLQGPKGSGKTLHGRILAKKFGVFHISFKDRLQELILHKTLKRIGPDYENQGGDDESKENEDYIETGDEIEGEESEVKIEFSEFEENIRNNILNGEALTKETLDQILIPWWKEEPFKSKGFILEGFPQTVEEVKYLTSSGLYPDGSVFLSVEAETVCNRLFTPIYDVWKVARDKRLKLRSEKRKETMALREEARQRKKKEKLEEQEQRRFERSQREESDEEIEEDEDYDIDEMVEMEIIDEFGEMEEEEEEDETEEEAMERIKGELTDKYEEEMVVLEGVMESLEDEMIRRIDVDASRKPPIAQYVLMKLLKPQVVHRDSLFDKCHTITRQLALKLLNQGYKQPSRFGRWCPVKLYDQEVLPPFVSKENPTYPVIFRDYIYFLSSEENKERFMAQPQMYITQARTRPLVPIKIMIIGPPKSGKTTLANGFVKEFGLVRLSIGEILRKVISTHPHTILVREILDFLTKGFTIPDELTIQALEIYLLDPQCVTRGYVLDGFPVTLKQMNLLRDRSIIPYKVIVLNISDEVIMQRAAADRKSPAKQHPLHDSFTITAIRVAAYRKDSTAIETFYQESYKNVFTMDGTESKWLIYNEATKEVKKAVAHIQTYIENTATDRAAPIKHLCVTPAEFEARIGEFGQYCPVSLDEKGELVDCSGDTSNDFVAIFRGQYYKCKNKENLDKFLSVPSKYTPPLTLAKLPQECDLPIRRSETFVKQAFPKKLELQGYCPVTYLDGKLRYEAIIPGENSFVAEYKSKLYTFVSEEKLGKFMRHPRKYSNLTLPTKLPPKRDPINVTALPMLGYMEQTVATAVTKSLTSVGCFKPKHPFLTAKKSALLYVAYHLKAYNPKASDHVRKKYKKLLMDFEDNCQLIGYLSNTMKKRYVDPEDRPIDFDHKLTSFLSLQPAH